MSVARLLERGKTEIGCVSTGNVGTAVASLAAKAGVDAYVFYPNRLEDTKARGCMALGAKVCQVEGNYDEANRRCREVAEATGMDFANITLRPFYAEGAKTAAFEIVEQLDWHSPDHIVTAGRRRHALLAPAQGPERAAAARARPRPTATRIHIAQPSGCNPIASAILAEEAEVRPGDARDGRPLARDRRARRRLPGDRRRPQTRRHRRLRQRPGDLRRHRPAGRDRGPADRAGRRHDDRGAREARRRRALRPRRHGRGDHHRQRPEDARRPPAEAVAGEGRLRARRDARRARASSRAAAR